MPWTASPGSNTTTVQRIMPNNAQRVSESSRSGSSECRAAAAPGSVDRILVCQLRQIGDVLLATPSLSLLARQYPGTELHVFTEKKCVPMLENNPYVHTIWAVDKTAFASVVHEYAWYRHIAARRFDLVVDFQQLPRCRAVVLMSRAKTRLSFPPPWYLRPLYTHWTLPDPVYAAAYKAGVLAPLGIRWNGEKPEIWLTDGERAEARALLTSMGLKSGCFITVDVTHRQPTRRWPARHYAHLIDLLAEHLPGVRFLLPFGPGEEEEIRGLQAMCRSSEAIAIPESMLGLRQLAACMGHAALHLGNCSSPRHMAVALGVPTVIIQGATGGGWQFPAPEHISIAAGHFMDMPCQPCNKNSCPQNAPCLERLTPELALPAVLAHFKQYGRHQSPAM